MLDLFFVEAGRCHLSEDFLAAGTGYSLAALRNKNERIEWGSYLRFVANARTVWGDDDFIRLGGSFTKSPLMRPFGVIARLLFETKELYRWISTGGGMFTNMKTEFVDVGDQRLVVHVSIEEGYPNCPEFFLLTKGGFIELPTMLGFAPSQVEMKLSERGARYEIEIPRGGGALAWLRKAITWPFTARAAARELKDAHEQLQLQASHLSDAHSIHERVQGQLDLVSTLEAIARALVEVGRYDEARVEVSADVETRRVEHSARFGETNVREDFRVVPLATARRILGQLRLRGGTNDFAGRDALLDLIVPTLTLAVDRALSFQAVADYRDNLERKVAERTAELTAANERIGSTLEELMAVQATRQRLFANINHEIRIPLTLIINGTSIILNRYGSLMDDKARTVLASVDDSTRRLLRLVNDLLLLAAGQEKKLKLTPRRSDLGIALRLLVAGWTGVADNRGLRLGYEGPRTLHTVFDGAALDRVINNLLSNAVKFTPAGGTIEVRLVDGDLAVEISVRDSGIGIDAEFRRRMFERFEQGRPSVHAGAQGSGIGLSLVKELVEAHGGTVGVESPQGGGTIFVVSLPRSLPEVAEVEDDGKDIDKLVEARALGPADFGQQIVDPPPEELLPPSGTWGATILVAEDDPEVRGAIARMLAEEYRVLSAPDGLAALHLAREHLPDLLISDVGMPGMEGLELTRRFRELSGSRLAPVILLSAYSDMDTRLQGFDAGAVDYLVKPVAPSELRARVRSLIALRSLALKLRETEKLAALGVLSAGLAHELRNPANALVNAVHPLRELLPEEFTRPEAPTAQLLLVLERCAEQIGRLSRQLLGVRRGDQQGPTEQPLSQLISHALLLVQPLLKDVELRRALDYDGAVCGSAPMLAQVIANLIENSVQAIGAGGWVRLATRAEKGRVHIEVGDSGPGVPAHLRERVFEPFFTTKPPGQGTGLGLTISRQIVEEHGGQLAIRENAGRVFFVIDLPAPEAGAAGRRGQV